MVERPRARVGLGLNCYVIVFKSFSNSHVHTETLSQRFQIYPLWRAFSNLSVFGVWKRRLRVDGTRNRINIYPFSNLSGYVWTGPYYLHFLLQSKNSKDPIESNHVMTWIRIQFERQFNLFFVVCNNIQYSFLIWCMQFLWNMRLIKAVCYFRQISVFFFFSLLVVINRWNRDDILWF